MRTRIALLGLVTVLGTIAFGLLGCSRDEPVDPTSAAALKRADSIQYGCSYVRHESTSEIGGREKSSRTPGCSPQTRCDDVTPPDSFHYGLGGDSYSSYVFFEDKIDFIGTCEDQQPISCEYLTEGGDECGACQASACCGSVYLCEHDPNCVAILDCLDGCKEDDACQQRCVSNGDYHAKKNLQAAVTCIANMCKTECGW